MPQKIAVGTIRSFVCSFEIIKLEIIRSFMVEESSLESNVWTQRSLGIELPKDFESLTAFDIKYICNNFYPFLQVINSDAVFSEETKVNFVPASTGWTIHDYGEAISTSAPKNSDGNSRILAQYQTMADVATLIAAKRWAAVELISGTQKMQSFLWIELKRYDLELKGYEPSDNDKKLSERLKKHVEAKGLTWEKGLPTALKDKFNVSGASE